MKETYNKAADFSVGDVIGFHAFEKDACVSRIFALRDAVKPGEAAAYVVFAGVPAVINCMEKPELRQVYRQAALTLTDGMPIVKLARRKGLVCEKCCGPELLQRVAEQGLATGKKHYFYGCTPQTLALMEKKLREKYPEIQIVGSYAPPFRALREEEDRADVERINRAAPDFLWVGLGSPKQDVWMHRHQDSIKGCVMFGVGAAFDFWAGNIKRPPAWVDRLGLEWFYRFLQEPKRLLRRNIGGAIKFAWYRAAGKCNVRRLHKEPGEMQGTVSAE